MGSQQPVSEPSVQWFKPTSGRVSGVLGLVGAGVVLVVALMGRAGVEYVVGGLLFALLVWVTLLRPRVGLRADDLLLRGMVSTTVIPLASVDNVAVRQVLAVWAHGNRYVSAAVGMPYGDIARERRMGQRVPEEIPGADVKYARHIGDLVEDKARRARSDGRDAGEVRREWARPELAGIAVLLVALAVTIAV